MIAKLLETNRPGAPYSYDPNGNLTSTGNLYDVENRLVQATISGGTIHYAYHGSNKRTLAGKFHEFRRSAISGDGYSIDVRDRRAEAGHGDATKIRVAGFLKL
jgi:hypothetical protein